MSKEASARIALELELDRLRVTDPYTAEDIAFVAKVFGDDPDEIAELLATPIRPNKRPPG